MSQTPAPIPAPPSRFAPAGTPVWTSEEAARWSHLRPASWARPLWSVLALLITVVWAIAAPAAEPPCTDAAPCGADWPGTVEMGLAVGLLYWLARLPELTLVAAPVLAAVVARVELSDAGPNRPPAATGASRSAPSCSASPSSWPWPGPFTEA